MRHKNVDLTTMSQNNQAFSRISSGGSASGTGLQIAGLALDAFGGYKGTTPSGNTNTGYDPSFYNNYDGTSSGAGGLETMKF